MVLIPERVRKWDGRAGCWGSWRVHDAVDGDMRRVPKLHGVYSLPWNIY